MIEIISSQSIYQGYKFGHHISPTNIKADIIDVPSDNEQFNQYNRVLTTYNENGDLHSADANRPQNFSITV